MDILTYAKIKICKVKEMEHYNYKMKIFQGGILHTGLRMFQDEIILCVIEKSYKRA